MTQLLTQGSPLKGLLDHLSPGELRGQGLGLTGRGRRYRAGNV